MKPAYSYVRLSSAEQIKGFGATRQTKLAEDYAKAHGLRLSEQTFRDLGVSGYTGKHVTKGALGRFIALVERGKIPKGSVLLIEQLDRWSRQEPLEAVAQLHRLLKLGVEVVTLADGKSFTRESMRDNTGDLFFSVAVLMRAHEESLSKSRRGKLNWQAKRRNAATKPLTKMAPGWLTLGADGKWQVDAKRAKVVEHVFQLSAEGYGREAIAKRLNGEKVQPPTRRATTWHGSTVQKLISNAAVIGEFQPGYRETLEDGRWRRVADGEPISDYYPAIISRRLWLKTRKSARPRFPPGPKAENLFSGLLVCGFCRGRLHYFNKGESGGGAFLVCSNARRGLCKASRGWRYDKLEPLLLTLLHRVIRWETLVPSQRSMSKTALARLEEALASVEVEVGTVDKKLAKVAEAIEAVGVSQTLSSRLKALEGQREALEGQRVSARDRLDAERERLRSVSVSVQESKAAFQDWQQGKLSKDATARHRLAVVLRTMLARLVLTSPPARYGPSEDTRKLSVVFRQDGETTDFVVSPDLRMVHDTEGEVLVRV